MQVDEIKLQRQIEGTEIWRQNKGKGCLNYCTGVGKTFTACLIINKMLSKNSNTTFIVVVPSVELLTQWRAEIRLLVKENKQQIKVYTINFIQEHKLHLNCDVLILDELHEYYSKERQNVWNKTWINYRFILGLTATFEDNEGRHKDIIEFCPVIDIITEEEAIEKGFISKYIEYNIALELNETDKITYTKLTEGINRYFQKFGKVNPLGVAQMCLTGKGNMNGWTFCNIWAKNMGWYPEYANGNDEQREFDSLWNPKKIMGYASNLMKLIRERSDVINNNDAKIQVILDIIKKFEGIKTIVFGESTVFADKLGYLINKDYNKNIEPNSIGFYEICEVYHSNLVSRMCPSPKTGKLIKFGKKKLKTKAIERLKSGEAKYIITAKSLDRGFDVKDIRIGITASGTRNPTQYTQRGGRTKRIEKLEEDITVLIINVYFKNTVDEDKLKERQRKNKHKIYMVENINNIEYSPYKNKATIEI